MNENENYNHGKNKNSYNIDKKEIMEVMIEKENKENSLPKEEKIQIEKNSDNNSLNNSKIEDNNKKHNNDDNGNNDKEDKDLNNKNKDIYDKEILNNKNIDNNKNNENKISSINKSMSITDNESKMINKNVLLKEKLKEMNENTDDLITMNYTNNLLNNGFLSDNNDDNEEEEDFNLIPSLSLSFQENDNKLKLQENKPQSIVSKGIDYSINENMKKIEQFLEMDIDFNKNEQDEDINKNVNSKPRNQINFFNNLNVKEPKNKKEDDLFSDVSDSSDSDSILSFSNLKNIGKDQNDKDLKISEEEDDGREWWKI
jgi:hypothetical protein